MKLVSYTSPSALFYLVKRNRGFKELLIWLESLFKEFKVSGVALGSLQSVNNLLCWRHLPFTQETTSHAWCFPSGKSRDQKAERAGCKQHHCSLPCVPCFHCCPWLCFLPGLHLGPHHILDFMLQARCSSEKLLDVNLWIQITQKVGQKEKGSIWG